jgi:succinyl-diaminopimelate desuccinylase
MQDETGNLTMSPNLASYEDGILKMTVDVRFPATHKKEEVLLPFEVSGIGYSVDNYQAPLYNDPNGKLIQTLLGVYNEAMGVSETPIAIGGGTYARALACGCAFGPEVPGEESTIHQPNEYVTFERIALMNKIYYEAIVRLTASQEQSAVAKTESVKYHVAKIVKRYQ